MINFHPHNAPWFNGLTHFVEMQFLLSTELLAQAVFLTNKLFRNSVFATHLSQHIFIEKSNLLSKHTPAPLDYPIVHLMEQGSQ